MLYATKEMILRDIEALPPDYKTKDIDALRRDPDRTAPAPHLFLYFFKAIKKRL